MRNFVLILSVWMISFSSSHAGTFDQHLPDNISETFKLGYVTPNKYQITDFRFLSTIFNYIPLTNSYGVNPTSVLWPVGTIQNFGSVSCGSGSFTVAVEVFLAGVTDSPGQGNNIHCVVNLGKVASFGGTWNCIENFNMSYITDNGLNDVFNATISSLPPGLYEFTCACSDQGPFLDPTSAAGVTYISGSVPMNSFNNGQISVLPTAPNDDCTGALIPLNAGSNTVDNNCSIDGLVGFTYTVSTYGTVSLSATSGTLANPVIPMVRLTDPCNPPNIDPTMTCFAPGTILYILAGNDNPPCLEYGDFNINVTENGNPITAALTVTENSGVPNDGIVCVGDAFTITADPTGGGYSYLWDLNSTSIANPSNFLSIATATLLDGGTYNVTVTDGSGCSDIESVTVTISSLPVAAATTIDECESTGGGSSADFDLTEGDVAVSGGAPGVTVTYHSTLADANANSSVLISPYSSVSTTIFARVTDDVTGCYATSTVTLTVFPLPTGVQIQNTNNGNSTSDFTICSGENIDLNVAGTGAGTLQYDWTLPSGGNAAGSPINIASANNALHDGTWTVTVTDGNGCTATDDITVTVTPAPSNDDCSSADPFGSSGDNTCASQDVATCGASSEASVWFNYTVPAGMKTLTFTLSGLTNGVINVYNGCGGAAIGTTCTNSVTIDCPNGGDVYAIYVSSPAADSGPFNTSVTETPISAANDECSGAIAIPDSPVCTFFPVTGSTTVGACPENFTLSGCGLNYDTDAIVWYTFTTPTGANSVQFQNITGTLSVFDACPPTAAIGGGGCLSGPATVNISGGTTYYIGIGLPGTSGPVGFDIKYNVGPANDDCGAGDIDLGTGGSSAGTNACAGPDFSFNCGATSYESSVWFTITVEPGNSGIEFTVTGSGATPLLSGGAGTLFMDGCGGTVMGEACFSVGALSQILCIPPGTYDLQIATSTANSGDFDLTVNQIRGSNGAPANDLCDDATNIPLTLICAPITASGNNTDACNETFSIGGCSFGTDPTTWHTFTVDANATSIDITNITGGAYLGIFETSPCGTNTPVQLAGVGCITSNTAGIPVTGGTTYYIAVGHSSGTAYTFDITQNVTPPNDTPCTAETIGTATQNTTCCANQEVASPCGNGTEASVWFVVPAAPNVVTVDLSFSNISMSAPFVVDVFSGPDCNSFALVPDNDFRSACNTNSFNATLRCLDFETNNLYIRVGSDQASCGEFNLTATPNTGSCAASTDCATAPTTSVPTGGQACLPGCNLSLCGDGVCDPDGNATYYAFNVDPSTATAVVISVTGASFTPIISIAPDCFSPYISCFTGTISDPVPVGTGTIYVRVEAAGGQNLDDSFEVCANAFDGGAFDCYSATFTVSRPEHPTQNANGPYCAGEVVNFCYNVNFIVSPIGTVPPNGNNCQWIQGIVPVVYEGWDLVALPLSTQPAPGGANWLDEGIVHYNFNSPQYSPVTLPNGNLGLTWGAGGLSTGGAMPAGWYWASPGSGPDCTDGSNPDTAWGLPGGCGSTQNVNVCFNLKVKEFNTQQECEDASLRITMFSFADGELGCWTNLSCALSTPFEWTGQAACNSLITITGDDKETCSGIPVLVTATANNPNADIILTTTDNPNVTGETLSGTFPFGQMNLLETLVNTSMVPQIVEYNLYGVIPNQVCQSPPVTIRVTVYPELEGTFTPDPAYVCRPGDCIPLTINPTGGTGNYVSFQWSGQGVSGSGQTVNVCPITPTLYTVTFTDDLGCQGVESIEVDIKDPVTVTLDPTQIIACKDGIEGNVDPIFATVSSGLFPYNYIWTSPPGINGYGSSFYDPFGEDRYNLLEETSQPVSGTLLLTVTDSWGCTGTADAYISIDVGPDPTFTYDPIICGQTLVNLRAVFFIGSSSSGLERFELYACDGTFIGEEFNNTSIFTDIDMGVYGNCFTLLTYTGSGCVVERTLTVPITSGTPVVLSGNTQRCANGTPAVISVSNSGAYVSYIWSNNATTSSISVSPAMTTTYVVTATEANGCRNTASRTITVNPEPIVSFSGSTSICTGQNTILTASSDIPGSTFTWTNMAGMTFTGSSLTVSSADSIIVEAISPSGCIGKKTIKVIESSNLSPNINELTLCDNSTGVLDAGGVFHTYLGTHDSTTQTIEVNTSGIYWVSVTKSTCSGIDSVTVINNTTPVLIIPSAPIIVCRTNDGFGPSSVNFTSQISPVGLTGVWREITSSGVDIMTDLSNVSFLSVPAGNYQFEYTTDNAASPCTNVSDTLTITVNACQCPQILPTGPLCNAGSAAVNMVTKKGNPALGGTFSVISPSGINMVNNVFNPLGLAAGTYTIQWDLTPNCKPTIDVIIYDAPSVSIDLAQSTLCNDNATGSTTLDLNTIITSGSSNGSWKIVKGPASAFSAPSTADAIGLNKGDTLIYRFITNTAQQPCKNDSIDLLIIVRDCKCPEVTISPLTLCNGDNISIDLNSSAVLTTIPTGLTGTWTSSLAGAVTGNRFLNPLNLATGQHTITYQLSNPIVGCTNSFSGPVTIALQPKAEVVGPGTACNVNSGNGSTTVRLFDLLKPGYSASGQWSQTSGSPTLTITTNNQVDFTGQPVGSVFKFTYTRTANAPCNPITAEVTITVVDCMCPPININVPAPICNESGILDMSTLEGNPNSPGVWLVKNALGNIINTPNDILDGKNLTEGNYRLTYTLVPAPAGACQKDSTVILKIEKQNEAVTIDTVVCNVLSSQGPSALDLRSLLVSTTGGGKWVNIDGVDIPDFTNVSFVGSPLGTINYFYQLSSNAPCSNRLIPANVEVIDCSCEQIILQSIPSLCTDQPTFDLKPFSDPKPGVWKSTNTNISIVNGILNLNGLNAGMYEIYYELSTAPPAPCPVDKKMIITVFNPKSAGTARGAEFCEGATDIINLFDRLDNESSGGQWSVVSGGTVGFDATAGTFNLNGRSSGNYVFKYSITNQSPCPDDEEDVTIRINQIPVADAGADKQLNCLVQSAEIGTDLTSTGLNIIYEWKRGNTVVGTSKKYTALEGGIFTLTVRDTLTKCSSSDNMTVVLEDDLPVFDIAVDTIECFGQTGRIDLSNISGGKAPYQISFDGGITYGNLLSAINLKSGNYKVMVKDANGCVNDRYPIVNIVEPPLFTVNLGQDFQINIGEDTILSIEGQYSPTTAQSVIWKANGIEIANTRNQSSIVVTPESDTEYTVTVTNASGCIATDVVRIIIRRVKPECVPNIISLSSQSGNNYFSINCEEVDLVTKYSVYDRWGNLLFVGNNLSPTQPQSFWNGKFKGKDVVPGVYVYSIEMLFKDGSTENRAGDVTVIQ